VHAPIGAIRDSKVGRTRLVGAAGSLDVAPGVRLVMPPGFPVAYKAEARKSPVPFEDFAVARADEIDRPAHIRARFAAGY
jgi:putative NADH-flavin reductase